MSFSAIIRITASPARHRTVCFLALYLLAGSIPASDGRADDDYQPIYDPTLHVSRRSGPIRIDGRLDDPGWQGAARAGNFAEHNPGDQVKPPVDTEALITYDDEQLYVAFICYDDPRTIRASLCEREGIYSDDYIVLCIDTYAEAAWAYELAVNPYGIQGDVLFSRSGGEDMGFAIIFESAGMITEQGYQVEMAVPFSSLRFPNRPAQTWKVDFWRNHPREDRGQYSWAAYDRDDPCWPCQWGTVTGIENVKPGKGFEILPSLIGFQSGAIEGDGSVEDPYEFKNEDVDGEVSIGAKYAISSDLTAEVTYNPDFSQVEADPAQIDVNSTIALWYDERRPFFLEGSDLFRTWTPIVYTRSINDPELAAKVTARFDGTSIAYLAARDENTPVILPLEESSEFFVAGKSFSNILRARKTLGEDTYLGAIITDRRMDDGGSGTALSADGEIRFSKHFRLQWQALASHTEEPDDTSLTSDVNDQYLDGKTYTAAFDGESFWGHALIANLEERSRHFDLDLTYMEQSPTVRVDNGYLAMNNRREVGLFAGYTFYFEDHPVFNSIYPYITPGAAWNFDGVRKDAWMRLECDMQMTGQTSVHPSLMMSSERLQGIKFDDIWRFHFCAHSQFSDMMGFDGSINFGHLIARNEDPPVIGKEQFHNLGLNLKPRHNIRIEPSLIYNRSENRDTGEKLFEGYIFRTRMHYQFTRELSLRLLLQYDDFDTAWDVDPLITYRLSPFSLFYIGSTYDYGDLEEKDGSTRRRELTSRQYFLKLQYLFQI
jgi:hypothetical protein